MRKIEITYTQPSEFHLRNVYIRPKNAPFVYFRSVRDARVIAIIKLLAHLKEKR